MPFIWNDVAIVNAALASFGAGAIQSLDQSIAPGPAVAALYPSVVDGILAEHPWKCTLAARALTQIVADQTDGSNYNLEGWRYAYALPADRLYDPVEYLDDPRLADRPLRRFQIVGETLYCDEAAVWAIAPFRVDPSRWPPYLREAIIACVAAELCTTITGSTGLRQTLEVKAWGTPDQGRRGGKLGVAKRADSRNAGTKVLADNPLIAARFA